MRRQLAVVAALATALVAAPMVAASADDPEEMTIEAAVDQQVALGIQAVPKASASQLARSATGPQGANPFLAHVPDPATVDYHGWRAVMESRAEAAQKERDTARRTALAALPQPVLVDELEPDDLTGRNDTLRTGELIRGFGTDDNPRARVLGTLAPPPPVDVNLPTFDEDDGAIPLANDTGVAELFGAMETSAQLGDGPHGSAGSGTGDFDFYAVELDAGLTVTAETTVSAGFDSVLVVYDATGEIVASNDDGGAGLASLVRFTAPVTGTYYLMVAGFGGGTIFPVDPFDPASGLGTGSEGPYDLLVSTARSDVDVYAVDLRPGDVIGATIRGAGSRLEVFAPDGTQVMGSEQDASFLYPIDSPLPGGGNAVVAYPANVEGRHYVAVSGSQPGDYDATVEVYRAGLENDARRPVQTLFLDFDGARVNTAKFDPFAPGVRDLTGLAGFLGGWGLGPDDEDDLIDAIVANSRENLRRDLRERGLNEDFALRIRNSRDHRDSFGRDNVSRVVVGGTIAESGIPTIGIAQSIDVGNFGHEDDALVLLDLLSAPTPDPNSLNTFLAEDLTREQRIELIAEGVGNIVVHEAGHFFGNYHTDQFNPEPNIMDQGGNLPNIIGAGDDQLLGTADDVDVDFGVDVFVANEGFTGLEDTLNNTAFGLTRG